MQSFCGYLDKHYNSAWYTAVEHLNNFYATYVHR